VKQFRKLWGLIVVFTLVAVLTFTYVKRATAFTLIELQFTGPIELLAGTVFVVNLTNHTSQTVDAVVDIYGRNGTLVEPQATLTLAANESRGFTYKQPAGTPANWVYARIGLGTANAVVTDVGIFGTNGELVVIADGVIPPAVTTALLLPAVQLVADQKACVFVSNVSTDTVNGAIDVYAGDGSVLIAQPISIPAGQTYCLTYTHPTGAFPIAIRAVVSLPNGGNVVGDMATFDVKSGQLITLLPAIPLSSGG